jgi:cytochrome c peroxidase
MKKVLRILGTEDQPVEGPADGGTKETAGPENAADLYKAAVSAGVQGKQHEAIAFYHRAVSAGAGFPVMALDNPFFLDLGVNRRRCITCHEPQSNMTVTPARLRARFDTSEGNDPIFRPNHGSNSPLTDTFTVEARRAAYSMLLTKGLIRIGLPIPATAEFELVSVQDPMRRTGLGFRPP